MTTTTNCKVFWPAPVCSGNGVCSESTGKCICNAGWSSIGDYALEEGVDCNINLTAVTVLWSIDLICYLISCIMLIRFHYIRCFKSKAPFKWSEPSTLNPLFYSISVIANIILACLRISSPNTRIIGGDPATTTALMFTACFASWTSISFIQINSKFLLSALKTMPEISRRKIKAQVIAFNESLPLVYTLGFISGMMPMFGLGYPQHIFWFAFAYHFIIAVPIIGFTLYGIHKILTPTLEELESHINSSKSMQSTHGMQVFIDIHKKLAIVRQQSHYTCLTISIFFLLLGSWPYITRNGSYVSAMTNMFGASSVIGVWTLSNPKNDKLTSQEGNCHEEKHDLPMNTSVQ